MTALIVANIVAWIAILCLGIAVLALARQVGLLHERLSPIGALTIDQGPQTGQMAPPLTLTPLTLTPLALTPITGGEIALGRPMPKPLLLFFLSPSCPVCKKLIPVLRALRASERGIGIVLASDGEEPEHRAFYAREKLTPFPYVLSPDLGLAFRISKLPYAVLIGADGRIAAKGLVNTREQIESLLVAQEMGVASLQDYAAQPESEARPEMSHAAD